MLCNNIQDDRKITRGVWNQSLTDYKISALSKVTKICWHNSTVIEFMKTTTTTKKNVCNKVA